jgi:small subunit ribosomal protein S8
MLDKVVLSKDSVSSLISCLKSAIKAEKVFVIVPFSRVSWAILEKFHEKGLIASCSLVDRFTIKVFLRYSLVFENCFTGLRRISKRGRRYYVTLLEMQKLNKQRNYLLLTSMGILWSSEAIDLGIGGELLLVF